MRYNIRIIICICAIVLFAIPQIGATAEEPLSLKATIDEALKSNPEILAAKRNAEAASTRIWQAASLNDPVIEFEYNKMVADRMLSGDPMKSYAISQEIPFPTKLFLRAKITSKLAKIAYEAYESKKVSIISQAKSVYSELFLIYRSIDINKESKDILQQFSKSATTRYSTGSGTQSDALKAQVELAKVDNELIILEQRRLTTQARLNILMNKDPKEEIGIPAEEEKIVFNKPLEDFYREAKLDNPELKMYRYGIEKGKAAYDLSLNEFMPDFMVKFQEMVRRDRFDDKMWAGMLGVTVPLWFFEKQAFGVKEMHAELEMLKAEYRTRENMVLFDVRDSYARVESNKKLVELYEIAFIPQAYQTMKAARVGYESSQADFMTLLDSERLYIEFKLDHYKAILDLRIALADLGRAAGVGSDKIDKRGRHEKK